MGDPKVLETQQWLNAQYGGHPQWNAVIEDGFTGWGTVFGLTRALQIELGITSLSDNFGAGTINAFISQFGSVNVNTGNVRVVRITQGALWCKGYSGGGAWGQYTVGVQASVQSLTSNMGLAASTSVSPKVLKGLLSMDAYSLLQGGNAEKRAVQQWLNGKYSSRRDFSLLPCDGIFSRNTQQGLMYAIQYEMGMNDGVANGNFGSGTKTGLTNQGGVGRGSHDYDKNWVRLFQGALRMNNYLAPFSGDFDATTETRTRDFQIFAELPSHGSGDYTTWASLLISTGNEDRAASAADMATQLNASLCASLYSNGFRTVGRYLTVTTKRYLPGELQRIFSAGLSTFPIMQEGNTAPEQFTYEKGLDHGQQAARRLRQLGFKADTTVFFAVDFDATDDAVSTRVTPYFQGVNEYLARTRVPYRVGIYGTRNVCSRIINANLAREAFVASMSWGWSGNLGYALPPSWSYDQIKTYTLPGTSMPIDKNVISVRARPVTQLTIDATPVVSGAFDSFFWMITHLTVMAEITGRVFGNDILSQAVLFYVQGKNAEYLTAKFQAYLPPPADPAARTFAAQFPGWATSAESTASETHFISAFPVNGGTPVGTSHLAVTARGYSTWGKPGPSSYSIVTVADLGGWALDYASLWAQYSRANPGATSKAAAKNYFAARLGVRDSNASTQGPFSFDDLVGDIDGFLIGGRIADSPQRRLDDIVREVRLSVSASNTWRFSEFYAQRFGANWSYAKAAAQDALASGNIAIGIAVEYTIGTYSLPTNESGTGARLPTTAEREGAAEAWADLLVALASTGAGAAPS